MQESTRLWLRSPSSAYIAVYIGPFVFFSSFFVVLLQFLSDFHHTLVSLLLEALCFTQVLLVAYGGSRSDIIPEFPLSFKENSVKVHNPPAVC